ncbi:MAG: hypothetical protein PVG35_04960 [Desulfobacterales bacterium]|jgi:hypothetical protein
MLDTLIDFVGAVCAIMLVWCLVRSYLRKTDDKTEAAQIETEDYIQKVTQVTGISAYETFRKCAEDWHISSDRINKDFSKYLTSQTIPYYVKDFVRKSQTQIDDLYRGKGTSSTDKRLWVFYFLLILLFWGGAIFLSLYVFPHFWPEEFRTTIHLGPP